MTLYRTYRPKTFGELEGQEHVVQTLQGALSSGRIGHAYLFCGPRGTGKTTMARLLAKALNCEKRDTEPCNKCFSCTEINAGKSMDLIEIDAASNRGIDEIRNVKESAQVAATSSRFKVFIVDEVHMLTTPAFNALLKTLEEPPSHTLFILATTEPHKVPETILSRVQRFDFKKLNHDQIIAKLRTVAKAENLTMDDESFRAIATAASGSLRDAESALAKVISYTGTTINGEETSKILGIIPLKVHEELLSLIAQKQTAQAIAKIADLHESGVHLDHFAKQFIDYLRAELLAQLPNASLVPVVQRFMQARQDLRHSPIPQLPLELAIIDLTTHASR
ncbi:MAG: DNA polymerase III subunit gamma/tau [Patescibacteria group bacterium]